jgi:hypothetical protein
MNMSVRDHPTTGAQLLREVHDNSLAVMLGVDDGDDEQKWADCVELDGNMCLNLPEFVGGFGACVSMWVDKVSSQWGSITGGANMVEEGRRTQEDCQARANLGEEGVAICVRIAC